jgi:hypothetical protein
VANANLGADQNKSLTDQLNYTPLASNAGTANDPNHDPTVYGDWYQWGRKKDGHEKRTVLAAGTSADYLTGKGGGVETTKLNANGQITDTEYAGKFIQRNDGIFDWRQYPASDPTNTDVAPAGAWTWNNTDNDPCQSELGGSWRVPSQVEWAQIASSNTWIWRDGAGNTTSGYEIKPGGAGKPTSLFLPAAGYRSRIGGAQLGVGANGDYWSSTVAGTLSCNLGFTSGSIYSADANYRSNGYTVRCVSESFD